MSFLQSQESYASKLVGAYFYRDKIQKKNKGDLGYAQPPLLIKILFFYETAFNFFNVDLLILSSAYFSVISNVFSSDPGISNIASVKIASQSERKPRAPNLYSTALSPM